MIPLKTLALAILALPAATPLVAQGGLTTDPRIAQLLSSVSEQRIRATVDRLASFRTRHTLSSVTDATAGIGAARQWIHDEMKSLAPGSR
jgi:hypothetical protein